MNDHLVLHREHRTLNCGKLFGLGFLLKLRMALASFLLTLYLVAAVLFRLN